MSKHTKPAPKKLSVKKANVRKLDDASLNEAAGGLPCNTADTGNPLVGCRCCAGHTK